MLGGSLSWCHRSVTRLADEEYTKLLAFRTGLRQFLRWSEDQAATVGLTPAQHQLLLAIRGKQDLKTKQKK